MSAITFESTPNPDALRVLPGRAIAPGQPRQFVRNGPGHDPLADALLAIPGVERILIGPDFVTIVRTGPDRVWEDIRPEVAFALADYFERDDEPAPAPVVPSAELLGEIEQQIEDVLDRWVRPLLAADGGEAVFVRFDADDGTAWIRMEGACGGCPSGSITLKQSIERTIRRWVPEVTSVRTAESEEAVATDPRARFRAWVAARWGNAKG